VDSDRIVAKVEVSVSILTSHLQFTKITVTASRATQRRLAQSPTATHSKGQMCPRTIRPMILRHQSTARRRGFDRADMEFAGQLAKASRMTCENVSMSALAIYH
jgi:hypothetical protein